MKKLLIASHNPGKITEIIHLLGEMNTRLVTPFDLEITSEVEESGSTYAENASLKAATYAKLTGMTAIADDTGLEVDVINGAPGLHSKRFSGRTGATDADRRALLIERLARYPQPWVARFFCVVAVGTPEGELYLSEGECRGEIISKERGQHGFGYDPIFLIEGLDLTMAELELARKNLISHRARAVKAAIPLLITLLNR